MQDSVWAICERVAEAQAILHDNRQDALARLDSLFKEEGLLRALYEVGYFVTPPPGILGN